ncbi:DNA-binding GntR family transcriptional regulator [Comamonas sp. 4034]
MVIRLPGELGCRLCCAASDSLFDADGLTVWQAFFPYPMSPRTVQTKPLPPPKRRAADMAYDAIEALICTLELQPGSPVVEAEIAERTGLGRTPVREALLRMVSIGLIEPQPRRGLLVSGIDLAGHLDIVATRRVLDQLIAACAARRATTHQREEIVRCAARMHDAAERGRIDDYMRADHELDTISHLASRNLPAVNCVVPLIVQCRRFWYAYQHAGDLMEGARAHLAFAQGISSGNEAAAVAGSNQLMDYLEHFARRIIDQ